MSATGESPKALRCPQCGASLPFTAEGYAVCRYCGSSLVWKRGEAEAGPAEGMAVRGIRLKPFVYTDTEGTGLELFRMLVPVGWQVQGGCRWLLDNPSMPAVVAFQAFNPQGAQAFEVLPNMNLTWSDNPTTRMLFPIGARYFGAEVRPPMGIRQAMHELVLPRYRSMMQNLRILREEPMPDLPQAARSDAPLTGGAAEGGMVRISYDWQGVSFEENIYGMVEMWRTPIPGMFGSTQLVTWLVDFLFSIRAAQGQLDAAGDLFKVMLGSFRLNPHWYAAFRSIIHQLGQMQVQRIHHIGEIGSIYARTGSEMREQNLRDWYARQEVYDRLATDQSRAIRGVDAFYDPHREEVVELPSGYGHAWADNLGGYIVTDDPNFNPNTQSNLHWEPMEQR
jgi:hypothetical protein